MSDWALEIMQQNASNINKIKRPFFFLILLNRNAEIAAGDKLQQDVRALSAGPMEKPQHCIQITP
jgi:hypothetical protein